MSGNVCLALGQVLKNLQKSLKIVQELLIIPVHVQYVNINNTKNYNTT